MDPAYIVVILAGAGVAFAITWRRLGDGKSMGDASEDSQKFLEMRFQRGFDGEKQMVQPPRLKIRFALSLISALLYAVVLATFLKWILLPWWQR